MLMSPENVVVPPFAVVNANRHCVAVASEAADRLVGIERQGGGLLTVTADASPMPVPPTASTPSLMKVGPV